MGRLDGFFAEHHPFVGGFLKFRPWVIHFPRVSVASPRPSLRQSIVLTLDIFPISLVRKAVQAVGQLEPVEEIEIGAEQRPAFATIVHPSVPPDDFAWFDSHDVITSSAHTILLSPSGDAISIEGELTGDMVELPSGSRPTAGGGFGDLFIGKLRNSQVKLAMKRARFTLYDWAGAEKAIEVRCP